MDIGGDVDASRYLCVDEVSETREPERPDDLSDISAPNVSPEFAFHRSKKFAALMAVSLLFHLLGGLVYLTGPAHLTRSAPDPASVVVNSSYLDIVDGDLELAYEEFLRNEVTAILYYAPWDAKSIETLGIFNELGSEMPDVKFVAINCWQKSACSKYYDARLYPTLYVYVRGLGTIQNPVGRLQKDYIATFIYNVINPMTVIRDQLEWNKFRASHLAVVSVPVNYFRFGYALALENLKSDPLRRIGFGLVWGKGTDIELHTWRSTITYGESDNPTVSVLNKWILANYEEPVHYLTNTGFKSLELRKIMNNTGAVMFVKNSKDHGLDSFYHMLALHIFTCPSSIHEHTHSLFQGLLLKSREADPRSKFPMECSASNSLSSSGTKAGSRSTILDPVQGSMSRDLASSGLCNLDPSDLSFRWDWDLTLTQTCHVTERDRVHWTDSERILRTIHGRTSVKHEPNSDLLGLACNGHDSFRIVIVDESAFGDETPLEAPAVIYDRREDVKFLMTEELTPTNVENFVGRYLTSRRGLEKSATVVRRNHFDVGGSQRRPTLFVAPQSLERDSVIFFYTNWCGFCKSVTATFLRVSRFFGSTPIDFQRVDAEGFRFPKVQFSPDSFPQVVFYPRNSNDSFRFHGEWSPQALTRFILGHIGDDVLQKL